MFGMCAPCYDGAINFEHVTLNVHVTFDLLLINFNIGHDLYYPKK